MPVEFMGFNPIYSLNIRFPEKERENAGIPDESGQVGIRLKNFLHASFSRRYKDYMKLTPAESDIMNFSG
jgi:hypothetical protein